ncbi:hypothetical protein [Thioalkalivibrio sp. HK1]|uniref:hypothetical protein n=1 Tax=Thioalkalivibrio sp. HK1 TaxID=1469245 RepID=UPI000471FAAC|nr:hypothetical protein [Thioalkalivibrio sp. HK1]
MSGKVKRRRFVGLCGTAALTTVANPALLAAAAAEGGKVRFYERSRLVDAKGEPISESRIERGRSHIFHYPYASTPCFLLKLDRPAPESIDLVTEDGTPYRWPGGVGKDRSVVAFAAICAHRMSHPARDVSFIDYRPEALHFVDRRGTSREEKGLIFCCSERSVYDPAGGARVLSGPARQPLTAIVLAVDPRSGALEAQGTVGGEMYDEFFERFGFRLAMEHAGKDIKRPVGATSTVIDIERYSRVRMRC